MGNSQSISKVKRVVKEAFNIYKTIKKAQEEQEQQQQHNSNYQQGSSSNQYQESSSYQQHTSTHYNSSSTNDDAHYASLREKAHIEAEKRNACYAQSQEAYANGDGAEAKELSNQGHYHDDLMKKYNREAAEYIYSVKNEGRPENEIDLHGLFVAEASKKVEEAIKRCQRNGAENLTIIVGKGLHSPGQIAKLKPAIIELVKKYNVSCQPNIPNPGCLFIEFGKGTGDLSWLDMLTDKVNNDQCIVM